MSLRDVERAMIVFKYFCEKIHLFNDAVNQLAEAEVRILVVWIALVLCYECNYFRVQQAFLVM